ncbi:glycerophosphodiester phosphodiesterase domain-containing protein 4-like [Saccopteryx bilineata]|uniref:glycerophosphodiester phosphodiesterase domain-containing protein 4-like n=1 Tax=Saccopteryx bilineata TaxID=59482 RepID=UPI00338E4CDA
MFKKVNRIEVKGQKKNKKPKLWLFRIFNHKCVITYITACYSCRWKTKLEKKSRWKLCCYSGTEGLFSLFLLIAFCMSVILLFLWIEASNEYPDFDWAVYQITRGWFFWSILLLSLFGIMTAYTLLLLVLRYLLLWKGNEPYLHWGHKILTLLVIGICTFFLIISRIYWNNEWLSFGLSLRVFAPYIHLSCVTVMVLLSWPVASSLVNLELEARYRRDKIIQHKRKRSQRCDRVTKLRAVQVAIGLPFFLILICLFVMPFGMYSPCLQKKDELGPKPVIFGRRGAPMLGPENTIMSFEKAVENGAFGLEPDVHLSFDGVPFLMHDHDLRRTTNIKEVKPNASFRGGSLFYWNFLSTLNAGQWFVQPQLRPFYNMKPLSNADREKARKQMIPKLSDLLEIARKERKYVIFHLNTPPAKHPFRNTFVRKVVNVTLDSKIEHHLIYWLPAFDRKYVQETAPGFQQVDRLHTVEELRKNNIRIINVNYKRLFHIKLKDYKVANITINLYLVNEPWLFSLAWCSKIHSVTTDNIQLLRQINHPYYFMTPSYYIFIWFIMDIISGMFIFAICYFHWCRENKKIEVTESTGSSTDTESNSLQEGKSKNQEASNLKTELPSRVSEIPWTLRHLYPALTNSTTSPEIGAIFNIKLAAKPEALGSSRLTVSVEPGAAIPCRAHRRKPRPRGLHLCGSVPVGQGHQAPQTQGGLWWAYRKSPQV